MVIFKHIIVLIAFTSVVACPPPNFVEPCTCRNYEVTCKRRDLTLEQSTRHLRFAKFGLVFKKLKVELMKLKTLELHVLDDIMFLRLEVTNCKLDAINDEGVLNLPKLQAMIIKTSIYERTGDFELKIRKLPSLNRIELSDNYIKKIPNKWFGKDPPSLKYLILSENQIEYLEDKALQNLPDLEILYLNKNRLTKIQRSMLPYPKNNIQKINLSYNQLKDLPENIFSGLKSLKTVDLRHNQIHHLPENTWISVWSQLNVVHVRGNPLDCSSGIEWIAKYRLLSLSGSCASPNDRKGMWLITLIKILSHTPSRVQSKIDFAPQKIQNKRIK